MSTLERALGSVRRVPLDSSGGRWAVLREPAGIDEDGVGGRSSLEAIRLLDRLLVHETGAAARPGAAATLPLPERDLLLAAAWRMASGPTIADSRTCSACGARFDIDFDLDAVVEQARAAMGSLPVEDGVYVLPSGVRFRLPTGEDERAVLGLPDDEAEAALLARCLVAGDPRVDGPEVVAAMEQVGEGLDVDLDAACAECGHPHRVRFQIQDYLLGAFTADWSGLVDDIHRLAIAYHWSLGEILALPRARRRAFVALLDGDAAGRPATWP
jgi:hypothetical protein